LSPTILFVYTKFINTAAVPRDLRGPDWGYLVRSVATEVVVSMQRDHQVFESETGALWPALWVGASVVAMVAFSYWLSVM